MGTSARYLGPRAENPLIPSWLPPLPPPPDQLDLLPNPAEEPIAPEPEAPDQPQAQPENGADNGAEAPQAPVAAFQGSRTTFNRGLRGGGGGSGGAQGSFRRALSSYVAKGTKGGRNAARRMVTSIPTGRRIAHFAQQVGQVGVQRALRDLGLGDFVGRAPEEILGVLTDHFCPDGGTIDEAIARDAWNSTIEAIIEQGINDVGAMTPEQWQDVIAEFITHSIEAKAINDIGNDLTRLPADVEAVNQIQADLHGLIRGAVDDAIAGRLQGNQIIGQADLDGLIGGIYESAFDFLREILEDNDNE